MTEPPNGGGLPDRRRRGAIWAAGIVAGIGAGIVAERLVMRRELGRPDPERDEAFGTLPGEAITVTSFDGTELHGRVVGPANGPTLVFAHGITLDLTTWYYQWRALSARYRCVLYDQRGHGRSEPGHGNDYSVEALGEDLRAVLEATCPAGPVVVVGHSMGGMSIVSLADRHPEEFGGRIVGAILVDTTAADAIEEALGALGARVERALRPVSRWYTRDLRRVERIRKRIQRTGTDFAFLTARLTNFGPNASPAQVAYVSRIATNARPEIWAHAVASLVEMDLRHAVQNVRVPALVIVGDRDRLTPQASAQALLRALPQGRGVVLPGTGHLAMMERHAAVTRLIQDFAGEVLPTDVPAPAAAR